MYAIAHIDGRQFVLAPGATVDVPKQEAAVGSTVTFDKVLLLVGDDGATRIGMPILTTVKVKAEIVATAKGEKTYKFWKIRRKNSRKLVGHRQWFTRVKVTGIEG